MDLEEDETLTSSVTSAKLLKSDLCFLNTKLEVRFLLLDSNSYISLHLQYLHFN